MTISESEIPKCPEHEVKSKIRNIFVKEKILEEYSVKNYEIDPLFYEHYRKKIQVDEIGCKYILFRTDVYFTDYLLAVEIDKKRSYWQIPYFWREKTKRTRKKNLFVNLLELIRVKRAMMQTLKLVEYKHLSVDLKTDN